MEKYDYFFFAAPGASFSFRKSSPGSTPCIAAPHSMVSVFPAEHDLHPIPYESNTLAATGLALIALWSVIRFVIFDILKKLSRLKN